MQTSNTIGLSPIGSYTPRLADSVLPDTVPELRTALQDALKEIDQLRAQVQRIDRSDTGIVNWLQANSEIVELKVYGSAQSMQCWHFIVHRGASLRDMLLERMETHFHGAG